MTREEAIAWYRSIPKNGSGHERKSFRDQGFGMGSIAQSYWDEPRFTLGIEYGMMIAIARVFDIKPEEL